MNARNVLLLLVVGAIASLPPSAAQGAGVGLKAKPARPKATSLVTFSGRAGKRAGGKVTIQRRAGRKWRAIASGRTGKRGRYALTWITPSKRARVQVRALLGGRVSKTRKVTVRRRAKGAPKVRVSPKTRIISPSVVRSVPTAGQPGPVTYAGGNDIKKGAFVVVGQGKDTPNGFLGRVVDVDRGNGQTIAETVPATLIQAVPEGSTTLHAEKVTTRTYTRAAKVTCEGSAGFSVTPDVTFTAGLDFAGAWGGLFEGPTSASVTASASFTASVEAAVAASGSCALAKRALLTVKGPSVTGAVGPVPIVLTSNLTIYFDADAGVQGAITTSASAGFDASAGVAWTKAGGFTSSQSFEPNFGFEPPTLSASANVAAHLTPTVDVLLYGIGGPRVALQTGIEFDADTTKDPWWELKVPVRLTGSLAIPVLDLESPQLDIYSRDFPITDAGGAFGAPPSPPPAAVHNDASPLTSLAVGFGHSCAVRSSGGVACWGRNSSHQLGNGSTTQSNVPVTVTGITDAAAIAAGEDHTCALRTGGKISCWGLNTSGQLGNGTKTAQAAPVEVVGITNAVALALGTSHSCALLGTGKVQCWGDNGQYQLGDGTKDARSKPLVGGEVSGISDATAISGGFQHNCAVLKDGTAKCWGLNGAGQLGNGTNTASPLPVGVSGITNGVLVAAGAQHTCALRFDESVACWGYNFTGQVGDGSRTNRFSPVGVANLGSVTALGVGWDHSCAVVAGGSIQCWGNNEYGQRGNGWSGQFDNAISPVVGINDAKGVEAGSGHTCALRASGAVACWGYGLDGELGNGQSKSSSVPVPVTGFPAT